MLGELDLAGFAAAFLHGSEILWLVWNWSQRVGQIQWMLWMTVLCQSKTFDAVQQFPNLCVTSHVLSVRSPAGDYERSVTRGRGQPLVVVLTNGIGLALHVLRQGSAIGEQVGHAHRQVAPALGESHAPADGGIVKSIISGAWVETDPHDIPFIVPIAEQIVGPLTPESVPVTAVGREDGLLIAHLSPL